VLKKITKKNHVKEKKQEKKWRVIKKRRKLKLPRYSESEMDGFLVNFH
jgi:hypothetical protein